MVARVWSFLSYLCPSCLVSCLGSSLIVELFHFQLKSYKVKKWNSWNGGFIVKLKLVPICKMSLSARATCARAGTMKKNNTPNRLPHVRPCVSVLCVSCQRPVRGTRLSCVCSSMNAYVPSAWAGHTDIKGTLKESHYGLRYSIVPNDQFF